MISFKFLDKTLIKEFCERLFYILHSNMSTIAPTGNSYEDDYSIWSNIIKSELESPNRHIILIYNESTIVGFFMYSIKNHDTFKMEEIEILKDYQKNYNIFRLLYGYIIECLPPYVELVEASANKNNIKSQAILQMLGLKIASENQRTYFFKGCYNDLLCWFHHKN